MKLCSGFVKLHLLLLMSSPNKNKQYVFMNEYSRKYKEWFISIQSHPEALILEKKLKQFVL